VDALLEAGILRTTVRVRRIRAGLVVWRDARAYGARRSAHVSPLHRIGARLGASRRPRRSLRDQRCAGHAVPHAWARRARRAMDDHSARAQRSLGDALLQAPRRAPLWRVPGLVSREGFAAVVGRRRRQTIANRRGRRPPRGPRRTPAQCTALRAPCVTVARRREDGARVGCRVLPTRARAPHPRRPRVACPTRAPRCRTGDRACRRLLRTGEPLRRFSALRRSDGPAAAAGARSRGDRPGVLSRWMHRRRRGCSDCTCGRTSDDRRGGEARAQPHRARRRRPRRARVGRRCIHARARGRRRRARARRGPCRPRVASRIACRRGSGAARAHRRQARHSAATTRGAPALARLTNVATAVGRSASVARWHATSRES
jgi:hypothetical protein